MKREISNICNKQHIEIYVIKCKVEGQQALNLSWEWIVYDSK